MIALFRPQFRTDIYREALWLMDHASMDVAQRWKDGLRITIRSLCKNPFMGRERKDLEFSGIRSWGVQGFRRWIIFYEVRGASVVFHRVVSGTMNLYVLTLD
jgi:plasmid stabilization system protein ParE